MHSRHYYLILTLALITSLTIFSGCKRNIRSESGQQDKNEGSQNADALLISQIETFSIDVGENGQKVWKDLMAYPPNDLIKNLVRLQQSASKDDGLRIKI